MKKSKKINEGLFGAAKKFSDAFFNGLINNKADEITSKAMKAGVNQLAIDKMKQIQRDKVELEKILSQFPDIQK